MFNVKKIIDVCAKRKITPNQLLYVYSIYRGEWANIYKYLEEVKCLSVADLEYLESEGYIINWNLEKNKPKWQHSSLNYADNFEITDKFKRMIFIDTQQAGEELFQVYPKFININGKLVPTTKGDYYDGKPLGKQGQIYYGKEQLMELYGIKINNDFIQHEENLIGLKKAIKSKVQLPIIRSYIFDEMWLSLNSIESSEDYSKITIL